MKPRTAIALSGGVDSLMSAVLLKEAGHDIFGIHFITGFEKDDQTGETPGNFADSGESLPVTRIADLLNIPLHIIDCSSEFRHLVVDYFVRVYESGKTPNPCLVCNPKIKFGFVFSTAMKLGATHLATGHYARITKDDEKQVHLKKGFDRKKDQSYFLAFLSRDQLEGAVFPLGEFTKAEVRNMASRRGFSGYVHDESQDICFIRGSSYGEFLSKYAHIQSEPGPILDTSGRQIGEHQGLQHFTVGQRRGINCPASEPYYVIRMEKKRNQLIVGFKKDLLTTEFFTEKVHWIHRPESFPFKAEVRVRYRHEAVPCSIQQVDDKLCKVEFHEPQGAVAPGQGSVFYRDDEVLGGGWIR